MDDQDVPVIQIFFTCFRNEDYCLYDSVIEVFKTQGFKLIVIRKSKFVILKFELKARGYTFN